MKRRYQYLHPFSHKLGACCLIPKTSYFVQAFPAKLFVFELNNVKKPIKEIILPYANGITLQLDLESFCVHIFSDKFSFYLNHELILLKKRPKKEQGLERICFGITKKQEMERIAQRADMQEIFPIWFRLGQFFELPPLVEKKGIFSLIEDCEQKIGCKEEILQAFLTLFKASFRSIFLPRTEDDEWQNLFPSVDVKSSSLYLFREGWRLIRQLIFIEQENTLHFLPHLPSKLVSGRAYDLHWTAGRLHLEWSKHKIRKVTVMVEKEIEIKIHSPNISAFCFQPLNGKKIFYSENDAKFSLDKGIYIFNRFQK